MGPSFTSDFLTYSMSPLQIWPSFQMRPVFELINDSFETSDRRLFDNSAIENNPHRRKITTDFEITTSIRSKFYNGYVLQLIVLSRNYKPQLPVFAIIPQKMWSQRRAQSYFTQSISLYRNNLLLIEACGEKKFTIPSAFFKDIYLCMASDQYSFNSTHLLFF